VRMLGILQRLSICYAFLLLTHVATRYGDRILRVVAALFMLGLYCAQLFMMVEYSSGKEGCSSDNNLTDKCNFAGYVDHLILTDHHCWKGGYTDP